MFAEIRCFVVATNKLWCFLSLSLVLFVAKLIPGIYMFRCKAEVFFVGKLRALFVAELR